MDGQLMMNNNSEHATKVALKERGPVSSDARKLSQDDNDTGRSFGITDLWSIRRNARTFKIHNRIPRL